MPVSAKPSVQVFYTEWSLVKHMLIIQLYNHRQAGFVKRKYAQNEFQQKLSTLPKAGDVTWHEK